MSDASGATPEPVRGMVRQGDVLLVPVEEPVELGSEQAGDGEIVLALGELTGHAHVVRGRARTASTATMRYLIVDGPAALVHDEHAPIALAPGAYEVRRQREWAPEPGPAPERLTQWVSD